MNDTVSLKVWGEFALFTRPELKVERMSYRIPRDDQQTRINN